MGQRYCPVLFLPKVQLHPHNVTGLADQFVEPFGIHKPQPADSVCNSVEDGTGHAHVRCSKLKNIRKIYIVEIEQRAISSQCSKVSSGERELSGGGFARTRHSRASLDGM